MRPFCAGLAVLAFSILSFALPSPAKANPPYPAHFTYTAGQAFGFIGDESVYDGRWCQYVENFFYTRYPDRKMVFYNAGIKADTAQDVLERLDADVIERKLDYAIIQLGTWDGGLRSFDAAKARAFQLNVAELLNRLEDARIHPFLMSPSMVDIRTHRERTDLDPSYRFRLSNLAPDYNGVIAFYTALLGDLALDRRARFIDAWGALTAATARERRVNPAFSLVPEGLLPDAGGHAVMAAAVIDALSPEGAEREADILVLHGPGDPAWRSKVAGGVLTQLSGNDSQVSFIWLAKSLPWAMPEDAFIGSQLARVDERFNRERLQAIGLKEGNYELWIGGELMQTYSSDQLTRGIEIHLLWNRPEYRRGQAIANLNGKRYAETVRPMRDLWQQVKEVRVNYPADDARQQQILTQVTPKLNALRNTAREQADAIYEAAKPLARNYELRRVLTPEEQKAAATVPK